MSNYQATKAFLEDISKDINSLDGELQRNLEAIKKFNESDFEMLVKLVKYNILYTICLEKDIANLNQKINKFNQELVKFKNALKSDEERIDRIDDIYAWIKMITIVVTFVMTLLFERGLFMALMLSLGLNYMISFGMDFIKICLSDDTRKEYINQKIDSCKKVIDIHQIAIESLNKIKEMHEIECAYEIKKINEILPFVTEKQSPQLEKILNSTSVDNWAKDLYNKNQRYSKIRIKRRVKRNERYFD